MEAHQVVNDVVDTVPLHVAEVKYDSGVEMQLGNELTPTQVKNVPTVKWPAEKDALYTLIFTDPDGPSRQEPTFREVKHWLVINIPENNVDKGDTLAEYIGSGPPKDTGLHRYILLVYKQKERIVTDEKRVSNKSREGRISFKTREFAKKYDLGEPIAGNFYQAQYDDYVPILHAQLV